MTNGIYLLSGTNLGDRMANMARALELIEKEAGQLTGQSQLYETAAWGVHQQPLFLNQVLEIKSSLPPENLLKTLLNIENKMGRQRLQKWGERLIDLDILYYADEVLETEEIMIPHPRIAERRFCLVPLCEITPLLVHPVLKKTQLQLLEECSDKLEVNVVNF